MTIFVHIFRGWAIGIHHVGAGPILEFITEDKIGKMRRVRESGVFVAIAAATFVRPGANDASQIIQSSAVDSFREDQTTATIALAHTHAAHVASAEFVRCDKRSEWLTHLSQALLAPNHRQFNRLQIIAGQTMRCRQPPAGHSTHPSNRHRFLIECQVVLYANGRDVHFEFDVMRQHQQGNVIREQSIVVHITVHIIDLVDSQHLHFTAFAGVIVIPVIFAGCHSILRRWEWAIALRIPETVHGR